MITVDSFLQDLVRNSFFQDNIAWKNKDKKILESLSHQLKNGIFFTENQANLLLKIIDDYKSELSSVNSSVIELLATPVWSKSFRLLDTLKKIYISNTNLPEILVEFSYNKKIKDKLYNLSKSLDGDIYSQKNNLFSIQLTEQNICVLVENLKEFKFNFDKKILDFYNEIIEIRNTNPHGITFDELKNPNIIEKLSTDIGANNINNFTLLHDRKLRFQYQLKENILTDSLTSKIATRDQIDIHINSSTYSFQNILSSLKELHRLPLLIVFDQYNTTQCVDTLTVIHQAFKALDLEEKIGIYFRMDNNTNKIFNEKIAEFCYNSYLDSDTLLVGLSQKQLPKFIVKSNWKPKSIMCFSASFKNSKIYSYCDSVDLKICYTESKPVSGFDYAIM